MTRIMQASISLAAISFMACSAAQMYPGPRRPPLQVCTVEGGEGLDVISVDGRPATQKRVEVPIGRRILTYGRLDGAMRLVFSISCEGGRSYGLKSKKERSLYGGERQRWVVFDDDGGNVVASQR